MNLYKKLMYDETIYKDSILIKILYSNNYFNKNEFEDVAYFEPFYLKDFQGVKKKKAE